MIVFILSLVSLNVFAEVNQELQWKGSSRTLFDKANMNMDDIKSMTQSMFENIEQNCGENVEMPNKTYLPFPGGECDQAIFPHLKKSMNDPSTFDSTLVLKKLWVSKVGKALLKSLSGKGVSEFVVKAAMEELWFTKSDIGDTPFNRLFFGRDAVAKKDNVKFNSWYTFSIHRDKHTNCNYSVTGKSLPVLMTGKCENDPYVSWFIYPNHPFLDMVIYSLCAWRNDYDEINFTSQQCPVTVTGSNKNFLVETWIYGNEDNSRYLSHVEPNYDLKQEKQLSFAQGLNEVHKYE